jgi:hypothetical protein
MVLLLHYCTDWQWRAGAMRVEHLAIDGSVVTVEADADLTTGATATGWAVVPSLMRPYPFAIQPPRHSFIVEEAIRSAIPSVEILSMHSYALKDGELRLAEVRLPTATNGTRELTVGAWEGAAGCLSTSLVGLERDQLVEVFDTLQFSEHRGGLAIDSPVTPRPRTPEVLKEVPGLGLLDIRPGIAAELERVPRARGQVTRHGEVFRPRSTSDALLFVGHSTVVRIKPLPDADPRLMLAIAQELRVEWSPRSRN